MKTLKFKVLSFFNTLFVIAIVLLNLVYFSFYIWKIGLFNIERILHYRKIFTVRSFSLFFVYLNLFISFLSIYSFNLGSKALLLCLICMSLFSICVGSFSIFYTAVYATASIKAAFGINYFSNSILYIKLKERYPNGDFLKIQDFYISEFELVSKYFVYFEIISLLGILTTGIFGLIARFIQIHEVEKEIPRLRQSTVGVDGCSIRPMNTMIRINA